MLSLQAWGRPLAEILEGPPLTTEQRVELDTLWPVAITLQEYPDIALQAMTGIFIPPHQRTILYINHLGAGSNVNVSSRGTSKSTAVCILTATHRAACFSKRKGITLSAVGFRGGQLIYGDLKRWADGGWDSQEDGLLFLKASCTNPDVVHRGQNLWQVEFKSFSTLTTVPTTDEDKIRGLRGNDLYIDEANTAAETLITKVAEPFLVVAGDFAHGGAYAKQNCVFYTSTIDFDWRPFQKRITAARQALERDYAALQAAKRGDWATHEELSKEGLCDSTYTCFDYTDTIIRRQGRTRDGRPYTITWPNRDIPLRKYPEGVPFIERDANGHLKKFSGPVEGYATYPLSKKRIEEGLRSGATDEASWLSEQKNVTDSAQGGVYSNALVDRITFYGEHRFLVPYKKCSPAWKTRYAEDERNFAPQVLWRCSDPCVLGIDYGRTDDFAAFVVIRIGPMAKGTFDPYTGHGQTPWSNVVWAEQHRCASAKDVADKVYELMDRYNLVYFDDGEEDMWKVCRAIGLDVRNAGIGVRDELLRINQQELERGEFRIYDPLDKDERVLAFATERTSLPMLDAISPSDTLNSNLVEYTLGQMQNDLLFLPKWLPASMRQDDEALHAGYNSSLILSKQLRKLRQEPTRNARRFYMEGDTRLVENKKDLWAAMIYAAKQLRAHLIRQQMIDEAPPPMGGVITHVNQRRGMAGRVPGAVDARRPPVLRRRIY